MRNVFFPTDSILISGFLFQKRSMVETKVMSFTGLSVTTVARRHKEWFRWVMAWLVKGTDLVLSVRLSRPEKRLMSSSFASSIGFGVVEISEVFVEGGKGAKPVSPRNSYSS
jgi:hypothetical protein